MIPNAAGMLRISPVLSIPFSEIAIQAIRSQGAGGQNVNKVSTAAHLFFDVNRSSLPYSVKQRLLASRDRRITGTGTIVIKAQRHRSQEKNRDDALDRLREFILNAVFSPKKRKPTGPTKASGRRRLDGKSRRSRVKSHRSLPCADD